MWVMLRLPVTLGLAFKSVLANRWKAVVPMLAIAFATTMAAFSLNTVSAISKIGRNLALWGWDNSDVDIVRGGRRLSIAHEELLERLRKDEHIAAIVPRAQLEGQIPSRGDFSSKMISGFAYLGDMALLGVVNVEGRNPASPSEISIAVGTARDYAKKVGDSFEINLEGTTLQFTIVGIFQTLERLGQGFRVQASAVWRADPLFEPAAYGVRLVDRSQAEQFIQDVERQFGESLRAVKVTNLQISSVTDNMSLALLAVCLLFLMMSLIFVVNSTLLSVKEERSTFCVLKTLGMTPFELRMVCVLKLLLIACIALAVGLPTGVLLIPIVFDFVLPSLGIVAFPMETAIGPTLALIPIVLALTAAAAWLPAGSATLVNPRQFNLE
jgi:putative ABC transport system permease protein